MTTFDLTPLRDALPPIPQTAHHCTHCDLFYHRTWYHPSTSRCFFCMRFRAPNLTRYALLRETEWFYLQSGESDPASYYDMYIGLLHRWADRHRLPFTPKDRIYQMEILQSITTPSSSETENP